MTFHNKLFLIFSLFFTLFLCPLSSANEDILLGEDKFEVSEDYEDGEGGEDGKDGVSASSAEEVGWPDFGLYWFGKDNKNEKARPGLSNEFYDPKKKTVILIHGWQPGSLLSGNIPSFNPQQAGGPDINTANAWRDRGWNIGILYWIQFADEWEVKHAEAKIWTAWGPQYMRWISSSGAYEYLNTHLDMAELLAKSVLDNMESNFLGAELRIAGHSLGAQLALRVTERLHSYSSNELLKPKRVALLDPFSSNWGKKYLGYRWVGEVMRDIADYLKSLDVVLESYRSSLTSSNPFIGDENYGLLARTAFTELRPWYFSGFQIFEKHNMASWHYFWSFEFKPPIEYSTGRIAMSASTDLQTARHLMNSYIRLWHYSGHWTQTPHDDSMVFLQK